MADQWDRDPPTGAVPRDRRARDGDAGKGDMLGGLSAGVGDRLGVDEVVEADEPEGGVRPGTLYEDGFERS